MKAIWICIDTRALVVFVQKKKIDKNKCQQYWNPIVVFYKQFQCSVMDYMAWVYAGSNKELKEVS